MPKGTLSAPEIDPALPDIIHCLLRGNKEERKKSVEATFCPQIYLPPNQVLNENEMESNFW